MSSPKVTYSYANGSANTIRPTSVTYPDNTGGTRVLTYDYGTSGGMNDKLSRVENLGFGGTSNLVQPSYLGLGTQVRTDYTQPQVRWDLATGSSPNPYAGLDRFGRVIDNKWSNSSTSATLDQIKYTYDRASNRTTRENTVAKAQTTPQYFDELYGYDGSNRLTQMQRGQLAGTTSITNLQFAQDWDLDPTGNWQQFNEDSDGSGTNDLVQARTANPVNEITDITNSMGAPWVQPGYDAAGNMTTIPRGNEPEEGFTGVYDAWNRLVKLLDEDGNVAAEYAYDGLTRRIRKTTAAETRHYYYNAAWQILEERVGSATTYDRQYVWGLRYIDDCVLRDRKLTSSVERLYALQDANWNVDALVDIYGNVVERFSYSAYGVPTFLNPDFTTKAGSDYMWDVLYAGYKWDNDVTMYLVRYRWLYALLGCWGSRDVVGYESGDNNLQRYVENNSIGHTDPTGLFLQPQDPFKQFMPPPVIIDAAFELAFLAGSQVLEKFQKTFNYDFNCPVCADIKIVYSQLNPLFIILQTDFFSGWPVDRFKSNDLKGKKPDGITLLAKNSCKGDIKCRIFETSKTSKVGYIPLLTYMPQNIADIFAYQQAQLPGGQPAKFPYTTKIVAIYSYFADITYAIGRCVK